jgi:chromosome segregation ATPase
MAMLKKMILAGGAVTMLSGLSLGTPLWSYGRCATSWLTETASDAVPLEWEMKRARQMIEDLKPEIAKNAKQIAREKIEVAKLERQVAQVDEAIAKTQSDIERLSVDLRRGHNEYTYAGKTYTSVAVKEDLNNRFNRFKTRRETAEKLHQMLSAREASLRSAADRMDAMLASKSQLEVEVENLQARIGSLRVAQTSSELSLDDSHLSKTRQLLDEIATRIDVEEETVAVDTEYFGEIDLEETASEDLLDEISAYLGRPNQDANESVASIQLD